ncbi:UvrD-helicase domain-containing protein [Helicobacter sp. 11S02629-2]|uniref:UvrD-helicase domain-containing protein n=1 Tax=Helicobacter sp. 11S02629-2 TaxID=1476195 RepID=UPI000BA7ABD6|nr:UvrD-helicase domain-containing protein [Helicobacter sp. 11S02629-2]PAF43104.1 hypothetical protein BKH40_07250 [Helicobacter sp. 11S02629-2]
MDKNHTLLSASAGSGKTFALCLTYVALLLQKAEPSKIVAITFTKKASLEMSERILRFLKTLYGYSRGKTSDALAKSLLESLQKDFGLDESYITKNIENIYFNYLKSSTFIGTIDSLFNKILRRFSFFVGIKSDFKIDTIDKKALLQLFLEQILKNSQELNLLLGLMRSNDKTDLKDILGMLDTLHDKLFEFESYPINTFDIKEGQKESTLLESSLKSTFMDFKGFLENIVVSKGLDSNHQWIVDTFKNFSNKPLESNLFYNLEYRNLEAFKLSDTEKQTVANFQIKIQNILRQKEALKEKQNFYYLLKIVSLYEDALLRLSMESNTLSFDLVKQKVFELMVGKGTKEAKSLSPSLIEERGFNSEFFYFRLDGSFSHMLIDEFQDTSMMQYKIFSPLFEEFRSGKGTSEIAKKLFFVGDNKQSIYRFRGANPEVYKHAQSYTTQKLLEYNYRSSHEIVNFVNDIFSEAYKDTAITYTKQIPKSKEEGFVEVVLTQKNESEDTPAYTACLNALNHINFLLSKGIESKDIAILVMKRSIGKMLIDVAEEERLGLCFSIDNEEELSKANCVKIIFCALKLKALKDSLEALQDDYQKSIREKEAKLYQKKLNKLLGKSYFEDVPLPKDLDLSLSLPKQIKQVINAYHLNSEEALQFLELSLASTKNITIDLLYEKASEVKFTLKQTSSLQILTVHSSKGLEFKHVIFLDTNSSSRSESLLYDHDGLNLEKIVLKTKNRERIDESYAKTKKKDEDLNFIDKLNRLYVAFTRAKESLYISLVRPQKKGKDIASMLKLETFKKGHINPPLNQASKNDKSKSMESRKFHTFGIHPEAQSEYLKKDDESYKLIYSLGLKDSSLRGLALHRGLELSLGYKEGNPNLDSILSSEFGFFLDSKRLKALGTKALNLINDKALAGFFKDKKISSEVAFLSNKRLRRIDSLLYNAKDFVVLEFKSSFNPSLASSYKTQLKDYLSFIDTYYKPQTLKGLLVYITQSDIKTEQVLLQKGDV